jgi:hypothetical protein
MTYYANGNNRFRFHHATDSKVQWWSCSSASEYTTSFCRITTAGNVAYAVARYSLGLAPAFKV